MNRVIIITTTTGISLTGTILTTVEIESIKNLKTKGLLLITQANQGIEESTHQPLKEIMKNTKATPLQKKGIYKKNGAHLNVTPNGTAFLMTEKERSEERF